MTFLSRWTAWRAGTRARAGSGHQSSTGDRVGIFVGGVQKGGTSSLHGYLAAHPDLLAPSRKETHYFDDETVDWARPDYRVFHGFYGSRPQLARAFESTPIYIFWPPALARLATYNPDARLILLFRDPIGRAWSHWCMEYARAADRLPFAEAIRDGRARLEGLPPLHPDRRVYSYVERGLYGGQLRRLLNIFPRRQALFLRSSDLAADPVSTLGKVAEFLDLEPFPPLAPRTDRARPDIEYPSRMTDEDAAYLRDIYREDIAVFAGLSGLDVSDWPTMTGNWEQLSR